MTDDGKINSDSIKDGVREAMKDYLRIQEGARLDLQPMAFFYSAIKSAARSWLNDNREEIIDAIAKHAAGEERALPYRPRVERKRASHTKLEHGRTEAALRKNQR